MEEKKVKKFKIWYKMYSKTGEFLETASDGIKYTYTVRQVWVEAKDKHAAYWSAIKMVPTVNRCVKVLVAEVNENKAIIG